MNHLEFHFEVNTLESKIKKNLLNRLYSNVKGSKKKFFATNYCVLESDLCYCPIKIFIVILNP